MNRVTVLLISWPDGHPRPMLRNVPSFEEGAFDFVDLSDPTDEPHVIITVGPDNARLMRAEQTQTDVRRRWIHYDTAPNPFETGNDIMTCFIRNACAPEGDFQFDNAPLVSVITPTHGIGANLERCLESLKRQTYQNWEWVIYINGDRWAFALEPKSVFDFSRLHPERVSVVRDADVPGSVGAIKRRAFGCARGQILLELDHDDELTPNALADLVAASIDHPECGFFYSDCAEVRDGTYEPITYGPGWGLGYGSYREESVSVLGSNKNGTDVITNVTNYPPINQKTLAHIVGVPNHFRAWRRGAYHWAGGHSPDLFVADDYELILRTFLVTRMCHVQELCYIQHERDATSTPMGAQEPVALVNTQDARRPEIQRLVKWIWMHYAKQVTERVNELTNGYVEHDIWIDAPCKDSEHLEAQWNRHCDDNPVVRLVPPIGLDPDLVAQANVQIPRIQSNWHES